MPDSENLYFESYGSGDPILFLHGLGANIFSWKQLVPYLEKKYTLMLLDLKGFGRSPKPFDGRYSIYDHAQCVLKFIRDHDLQNLIIVGNSFGGVVGLIVAEKLQQKNGALKALILIDSVGYRQELPWLVELMKIPLLGLISLALPAGPLVKMVIKNSFYDKKKIPHSEITEYSKLLLSWRAKYAFRQTAKGLPPPNAGELEKSYKNISIPTLIIWGKNDKVVPLELGKRFHAEIKNSEMIVFENCGHVPQEETPRETADAILAFLEKIEK